MPDTDGKMALEIFRLQEANRDRVSAELVKRGAVLLVDDMLFDLKRRVRSGKKVTLLCGSVETGRIVETNDLSVEGGNISMLFGIVDGRSTRIHQHNQDWVFAVKTETAVADIARETASEVMGTA